MNFCTDLDKNIIIIENYIRLGGSRAEKPTPANFCDFPLNFALATIIFSLKFAGRPPRHKLIIHNSGDKGVGEAKLPER